MCYMEASAASGGHGDLSDSGDERVGVRELRQNLSVYLRRIQAGETFTVTDRGTPVARLTAAPAKQQGLLERLVAEGKVISPRRPGGMRDMPPPVPRAAGAPSLQEVFDEQRAERL